MLTARTLRLLLAPAAAFVVACAVAQPTASPTSAPPATPSPTASPAPTPTASPTPSPSPSPTASPAATPSASPTPAPTRQPTPKPTDSPSGAVIATFEVGDEQYRIKIIDPEQVDIARRLFAGKEAPSIPNGRIVRGVTGVNTGWSWHIDPSDFEFADVTIELCDGLPSYVEDGTLTGDNFCPWSAELIELVPAP